MSSYATPQPGSAAKEPDPATVLITRFVQPGHEQDYRAWMGRLIAAAEVAPHSLGTVVLAPQEGESDTFRLIQRFADEASLSAWEDSDARVQLSAEADQFSSSQRQFATGTESWFSAAKAPAQPSPRKWKMAIATFCITYALTAILIPRETAWLPKSWSFYETDIITNVVLAAVMTYLLPSVTRRLGRLLY
jgi:antibiotic biosynthesis monooxygenase (ABM) superfamily enzyme